MAQSYLVFDFGTNEDAAQQARHRIEGWKQAFRLGSKLLLKFERQESQEKSQEKEEKQKAGKAKAKSEKGEKAEKADSPSDQSGQIRLFVRLDFSDHEKLSHQRWLDRIPTEEPFKSAKNQVINREDDGFEKTAELFDSLD